MDFKGSTGEKLESRDHKERRREHLKQKFSCPLGVGLLEQKNWDGDSTTKRRPVPRQPEVQMGLQDLCSETKWENPKFIRSTPGMAFKSRCFSIS